MVLNRLILPYAQLGDKRKQPFTSEMELAAVLCLTEAKRKKKSGILRGEPEKVGSISKLHYPVWFVPWENEYITVDGMNLFSFETIYKKLPDLVPFTAKIEKSVSYEQFMKVLEQNVETFEDFASYEKTTIEGIIDDKDLLSAILEYFKKEIASKEAQINESAFLEMKLDTKTAVAKVDGVIGLLKKNQLDIETLQKITSSLDNAADTVQDELSKNIEGVKKKYGDNIDAARPVVEERVRQLTNEKDEKIKTITTTMDKELETRTMEKTEYEKKLEQLTQEKSDYEEKKEAAKLRKDQVYVERWKLHLKGLDKQISDVEKKMRKLQKHIDDTRKEKEKTLKQINENYQAMIKTETDKIPNLEMARDQETSVIQEKIEQARSKTTAIVKRIQMLIEEKQDSIQKLKEIAVSWKLEDVFLVYMPFYAVNYLAETKQRYEFYAPVLASSPEGILKAIRKKILGSGLESRINLLLGQRSKALDKMFSSTLAKRAEEDYGLKNRLREKGEQNNVLARANFNKMLTEGLEELVKEEWVKPEEKNEILKLYAK